MNDGWIHSARLCAEEFKILKIQESKTSIPTEKMLTIRKHLDNNSDWSRKAYKYLSLQTQGHATKSKIDAAAKLAVSHSNAEEKLIAAIELAREGHFICSLTAASQIIKRKELTRDDRLGACMAVLENITANKSIIDESTNIREFKSKLLCASKFNHKITTILSSILDLYQNKKELDELSQLIEEAISLEDRKAASKNENIEKSSLINAKERNQIIKELSQIYEKPVIRSIHHFACTGGTLISKCLASMPNIALISEVNPMNRHDSQFTPTNPLLLLERSLRTFTTEEKLDIFKEQVAKAMLLCQKEDHDLILRDHSHTDFCVGNEVSDTYAIKDFLSEDYQLIYVLTVRHPLDSYLSLVSNGWEHFCPKGIHEYSRRYLAFIDKYSPSEIIRYEDFCENPPEVMKRICGILRIGYDKDFLNTFGKKILSGDSGRTGIEIIEKRKRRPVSKEIISELEKSTYYSELVDRLNY